MKITDLLDKLKDILYEHGDLDVGYQDDCGNFNPINIVERAPRAYTPRTDAECADMVARIY